MKAYRSRGCSDSDMDSDDDIPLQMRSPSTVSPTQQQFFTEDTHVPNAKWQIDPATTVTDLVDSDHNAPAKPPLKNSDIRSYYNSHSSTASQLAPPTRARAISKNTGPTDLTTCPPRALLELLYRSKQDSSKELLSSLQALPYREIRSQVMQHFAFLQTTDPTIHFGIHYR